MPNQDKSTQNQNPVSLSADPPVDQATTPPVAPVLFPQSDLPPLSPEFQNLSKNDVPAIPPVNSDAGSATPPDISSVIPKAKKKFGGGKIIATILGLVLLVGGIGAGIILIQQKQLVPQQASTTGTIRICHSTGSGANPYIVNNPDKTGDVGGHDGHNGPIWYSGIAGAWGDIIPPFNYDNGGHYNGKNWTDEGQAFYNNGCSTPAQSPTASPTVLPTALPTASPTVSPMATASPTESPTASPISPSCIPVRAYDDYWVTLTNVQLSALTAGDLVNFCVNGSATSGSFDKAQFMINSTIEPETTNKRPGSSDFCQSYTILSTDTTVSVKAKIHHSSGIWVGENF